jgi:hypothetical protein
MKLHTLAAVTGALVMSGLAVAQTPTPTPRTPSTDGTSVPPATSTPTPPSARTATPAPSTAGMSNVTFVQVQRPSEWLASKTVGSSVYNSANEKIGTISDLVVEGSAVQAVVVGVGGFLGMGEKHVAVDPKSIRMSPDERGNPKVILDATKEQLTSAPAYTFHKPS